MVTQTLYIDSCTKISGSHSDFKTNLAEQLTLRGARVRVDNIRTTDTFKTVSSRNKYIGIFPRWKWWPVVSCFGRSSLHGEHLRDGTDSQNHARLHVCSDK